MENKDEASMYLSGKGNRGRTGDTDSGIADFV